MAQLKIKRGLSSSLPTIEDGSLLITTDTKKIYLDNGSDRIELTTPPPVQSVNGKTGAVSLTYADVGAPSTNGSGASGTWGINITGNAATASKVNNVIPEWSGSVAWADTGWIAAWNADGTKIKALAKSSFAAANHTHDYAAASHTHNYLPLSGGTMSDQAWIAWPDTGNWNNSNAGVTFPVRHGGLQWSGQSDWIKIFSEESASDMLDMVMQFGDDGSSALKIRHSNGTDYVKISATGRIDATSVYGAVWNDYAEFRESNKQIQPGRVVIENGDDTLSLSNERLQPGANIVSDTYGFAIGETSRAQTPIAVSGRVLAYPYEPRDIFSAGDAVCSGPNGTVSKMTREEIVMYPERIIGTVSAIPDYETWGTGNVPVNGRIWIKVK